jgi:selenoprotein W-related protein
LTGKILEAFKTKIGEFKLVPSGGGCFEVTLDGKLIYSKLQTGEFPDEAAVLEKVEARLMQPA